MSRPGDRRLAVAAVDKAVERVRKSQNWTATAPRSNGIRELVLARALYRCGDKDGIGKEILEEYAKDLRGHFARHAHAVLEKGKRKDRKTRRREK